MTEIINLFKDLNFTSVLWQIITPLIFSLADILTGYVQAVINKNVDSQKMRTGLWHKFLIVVVIILSFVIELAFAIKYISSVVCIYVVVMELVSILENLKKAGIDIGRIGNILKEKHDIDTKVINNVVNKLDNIVDKEMKEE